MSSKNESVQITHVCFGFFFFAQIENSIAKDTSALVDSRHSKNLWVSHKSRFFLLCNKPQCWAYFRFQAIIARATMAAIVTT